MDAHAQGTGGALFVQSDAAQKLQFIIEQTVFQECDARFAAGAAAILGTWQFDITNTVLNNGTSKSGALLGTTALVTDSKYFTMNTTNLQGNSHLPVLANMDGLNLVGSANISCDRGQELQRSQSGNFIYYHCATCESGATAKADAPFRV